jgi:hypothetical protein
MRRAGMLMVLVTLAGCALLLPATARADDGTITPNPVAFGTVTTNSSAQATITFTNTSGADVTVTGIVVDNTDFALSATGTTSCDSNPTIPSSGTCTEDVTFTPTSVGAESGTITMSFSDTTTATATVTGTGTAPTPPPVRITSRSLTPGFFYPLVRDGYRDFATYRVAFNEAASGQVRIFNHKGTLTRSYPFTNRTRFAVAWGGRNRLGEKVKPGSYRFQVVAHTATSSVKTGFLRVVVKTGFRTVTTRGSKSKLGIDWSSRSSGAYSFGGNCNWGRLSGGALLTTCLFAHATVNYTFRLPRGAKVTQFTHHVQSGIAPCRHKSWSTRHSGRVRHATFFHGSVNGFSQCSIGTLTMAWRVRRKVRI